MYLRWLGRGVIAIRSLCAILVNPESEYMTMEGTTGCVDETVDSQERVSRTRNDEVDEQDAVL